MGGRRGLGVMDWIDRRTGWGAALRGVLDGPVPGGASPAHALGTVLAVVLLNQVVTGVLLAAYYAPSATTAWASVAYIQDQVWLGWFIRGLHAAGASVAVLALLLHLVQVTVYGAYRAPREVTWLSGVLLCGLVLAFAVTGYLLPWDQKGYWATQVVTTLVGALPLLGRGLQAAVQGGTAYGNLTVTHFFALHALALPALLIIFTAVHVTVFRRHGYTPRWGSSERERARRTEPYWPGQAVLDLGLGAGVLMFMVAWVVRTRGADLGAPADPSSAYDARPEWYFLPLYQLLKYFPGALEFMASLVAPLLAGGVLLGLPWLDRSRPLDTAPRARALPIGLVLGGLGLAGLLGVLAIAEDAGDRRYQEARREAERQARRARALAQKGVLPAGGTAVYFNDPLEMGRQLFAGQCASCHRLGTMGPAEDKDVRGPDLTGWSSREWLARFLRDPGGAAFFGTTRIHGMKPVKGGDDEVRALAEYVYSLSGALDADAGRVVEGKGLFSQKNCDTCHEVDGLTEGEGPNLGGHAGAAWVRGLLRDPASPLYYGEKDNDMPGYGTRLDDTELDQLAAFIAAQRDSR